MLLCDLLWMWDNKKILSVAAKSALPIDADSSVTLEVSGGTLTVSGAVFVITNGGECQIPFDQEDNPIQVYTGDAWYEIKVPYDITMKLMCLRPAKRTHLPLTGALCMENYRPGRIV